MMLLTISLLMATGQSAPLATADSYPAAWHSTVDDLAAPNAVAIMHDDRVLVTEPHRHRISVLNSNGSREATWGGPGVAPGSWHRPGGIDTNDGGVVAVADTGNHRVQFLNEHGQVLHVLNGAELTGLPFRSPADVSISSDWLAVADTGNHRVCVFNRNGSHAWSVDSDGTLPLHSPTGVAINDEGDLYIADTGNHRVVAFNKNGSHETTWGAWGRFPGLFAEPSGVELHQDLVYVADRLNHRIQVFTPGGELVTWWGMHAVIPRQGEGHIHYPSDIAISPSGNRAVVSEPFERRIQFFQPGPPSRPLRSKTRAPRGLQSHFGQQVDAGGRGLVTWEPEVRSLAVFVTDREVPIHVTTFGSPGEGTGRIGKIADLTWDQAGQVLTILDTGNDTIQRWRIALPSLDAMRYDPEAAALLDSTPMPEIKPGRRLQPGAAIQDDAGRLHVIDETLDQVITLTEDGIRPWDLAFDPVSLGTNGSTIAVADGRTGQVHLFDQEGKPLAVIGPAPGLEQPWPGGVDVLEDGTIVMSDSAADRIDHFSPTGSHLGTYSSPGNDHGQTWMPAGITQDALGRIVVLDHGNHRMQGFQPETGWILTFGLGRATTPERLQRRIKP